MLSYALCCSVLLCDGLHQCCKLTPSTEIVALYERIHAAGVVHRDPNPRHWRRRTDGRFMLIDFGHAMPIDTETADTAQWLVHDEMSTVRDILGLHPQPQS